MYFKVVLYNIIKTKINKMRKKLTLLSKIGISCGNFLTFCPIKLHRFFKTVLNKFKVGHIHHYYSYISEASHLMCTCF